MSRKYAPSAVIADQTKPVTKLRFTTTANTSPAHFLHPDLSCSWPMFGTLKPSQDNTACWDHSHPAQALDQAAVEGAEEGMVPDHKTQPLPDWNI
jgi:hypothetical protein